jgi:hypothetical protein
MSKKAAKEPQKDTPEDPTQKIRQTLDEALNNDDNVTLAVVIFVHKDADEPQVWRKGHWYDGSVMMNNALDAYKAKAAVELGLIGRG